MAIENQIIKAVPKMDIKKPAIKTDFASFKNLLDIDNWPYILGVLVIIFLVVLLIILIRRRHSKEAGKISEETEERKLSGSDLVKVWKRFIKEVPNEFRRSIMLYKPFIVIGESGTGKSLLIDNCTDWKGQAHQFYPSYTVDQLLQIYLGTRALVQEIPAALVNDTSKQAYYALQKLWKPLFKKKEPVVVVVLNGETLRTDPPESLKKSADMIRGKINILSRIRKQPVKVCIALTHMDQIEGFLEFSNFLRHNNIPLKIEFATQAGLQDLKNCLEPYESHLSRALTTLPAKDYLKIISFMKIAPELFSALSSYIKTLQKPDPLSIEPDVAGLSLTSHDGGETPISNPFASSLTDLDTRRFRPLLKHQLAAGALAIFGIGYLLFGYMYERGLLNELNESMNSFETNPPSHYESVAHELIINVASKLQYDQTLRFLPAFFPDIGQDIQQRLVSNIRKFYLIPRLKEVEGEEDAEEKTLHLLAIIFATKNNELGELALKYKNEWTQKLGLSQVLVEDYVRYNLTSNNITIPLDEMITHMAGGTSIYDPQQWIVYLHKISSAVQKPFITKNYFQKLISEAESLLNIIQKSEGDDLRIKISRLLRQETSLGPLISLTRKDDESQLSQEPLRETLRYLQQPVFVLPGTDHSNLDDFMEEVRVFMKLKDRTDSIFRFKIYTEEFVFETRRWSELINRSGLTLFIRDFMDQNAWHDGLLFFREDSKYDDIIMNPTNDGNLFFTGEGRVDGRFTRDAFEREVKPALTKLLDFINNLPIEEKERVAFTTFILNEIEAYSARYFSEFKDYYNRFGMIASTRKELLYVLNQIPLPFSQFHDFLMKVKENTVLDLGDSPYLRPLTLHLEAFKFIERLMRERKGALPELDKYKSILGQMQRELENEQPYIPNNKADISNDLNSRLSSMGRIALSILRDENESYLNLCEAWINSAGIPSGWDNLFLDPIQQAYLLGLPEVETVVREIWEDLYGMEIHAIMKNKFPFNMDALSDVTPDDMKNMFHQDGKFWTTFNKFLAPVCLKKGNTWHELKPPYSPFQLPQKMLEKVNNMATVSRTFWDEKGNPIPLLFSIKPLPLPPLKKNKPIVALSYLKSGKSSVFGFNQRPDWEKFEIEWWKNQTATVGIEFTTSLDSSKSYKVITGPKSPWSFYRLLLKSKIEDENILIWQFNSPESKRDFFPVQFEIRPNPWAFFQK